MSDMKLLAIRFDPVPGGGQMNVFVQGAHLHAVQAEDVKQVIEDIAHLILSENVQVVAEVVIEPEPDHPPQVDGDSVIGTDLFESMKKRITPPVQH